MSFTLQTLARRSSAPLRTQIRRQVVRPASVSRRGYVSVHDAAEKTSDLPWLIGAVGVTSVGLAFILSGVSASSEGGISASPAHHEGEPSKEEKAHTPKPAGSMPQSPYDKPKGDNSVPKGAADPSAPSKASPAGRNVPPPPADNSDLAEHWEERRERHEEMKALTRRGETRAASSSSTVPSKRIASEHPREDPKRGEGEAVQKGGPRD
ncbi:hypothetical protein F5Y03DRAFT_369501 [Xylaria venustula]|nr:hypothetical protein F5Y03DRAFT_369501 [Xylaria venustula]